MPEESQVQDEGFLDEFPPQVREDVNGLMYLGHLEDEFEFCGHHFVIQTLKGDADLLAALLCKAYMDTLGQGKAWAWAHVALAVTSVDHDTDFCPPLGPDREAFAKARFRYATRQWYWPLAEYIFSRYTVLIDRQRTAIEAMRDLSREDRTNFSLSPDSSTEVGDLENTEILDLDLVEDEDSTPSTT